jgi:hypothetical protein
MLKAVDVFLSEFMGAVVTLVTFLAGWFDRLKAHVKQSEQTETG